MFSPIEVDMEVDRLEQVRMTRKGDNRLLGVHRSPKIPKLPAPVPGSDGKLKPAEPTIKPTDSVVAGDVIYNGEQCSQAMQLFMTGKQPLEVMIEMKMVDATIDHLWKVYLRLQSFWPISHKTLSRFRSILDWNEEKPTEEGFWKAFKLYSERIIETEVKRRIKKEIGEPLTPEEAESVAQFDREEAAKEAMKRSVAAKPKE